MSLYEILNGLPPYGPEALPFSATGQGTHSEGFVVRFLPDSAPTWVGNFQPGLTDFDAVINHPDQERVLVISGGQAYVVNPTDPQFWEHFGSSIEFARPIDELDGIVLGNGLWFELLGAESMIWRTPRISWDGMCDIQISGLTLVGKSWDPNGTWCGFSVDLIDGKILGGSYNGPGSAAFAAG